MMRISLIFIIGAILANIANASNVELSIGEVYTHASPTADTLTLKFDDTWGATEVPNWLNGFADDQAKTGYIGTLKSQNFDYVSTIYFSYNPDRTFNIYESCSLTIKCYLKLAAPTNVMQQQIDPRQPGQLGAYLAENLSLLDALVGPNGGWNLSVNSPPSFPESFPRLLTVNTNAINVTSIPEPRTLSLFACGLFAIFYVFSSRKISQG